MRSRKKIKIIYEYIEPKTPEEKREQQIRINTAFDILFDHVYKRLSEKGRKIIPDAYKVG